MPVDKNWKLETTTTTTITFSFCLTRLFSRDYSRLGRVPIPQWSSEEPSGIAGAIKQSYVTLGCFTY